MGAIDGLLSSLTGKRNDKPPIFLANPFNGRLVKIMSKAAGLGFRSH